MIGEQIEQLCLVVLVNVKRVHDLVRLRVVAIWSGEDTHTVFLEYPANLTDEAWPIDDVLEGLQSHDVLELARGEWKRRSASCDERELMTRISRARRS